MLFRQQINLIKDISMFKKYMEQAMNCQVRAKEYLDKGEVNLAVFYMNAAKGYKEKAFELTLKEVLNG